ncbi:MAG: hypothetical protein OXS29_19450 [bacterium]|nr:hypothetical protein [bacterium]MDE0289774.1 hypothetical protein [bacterium]MDE0437337.1 hypothetical protein [bacterium]
MAEPRPEVREEAIIVDRGYRHYEGTRTGRRGAIRAIVREGFRRVIGLRRKAKRKLLPWALIVLALASVVVLVAISWATSQIPVSEGPADLIPRYRGYFDFISVVALLFAAYAGAQLLIPDRTEGVLNVYFSRPLALRDYLLGKALAYAAVILSFWLVPQLLLHLGMAALSREGFLSYLGRTTDILWQVPLAALGYFVLHASLSFLTAAFVNRVGGAAAAFLAGSLGLNLVALFLQEAVEEAPGTRWASLLATEQHPRYIRDWIFGVHESAEWIPAQAGFGPGVSLAVVVSLAVLSMALVGWRYRRLT